MRYVFATGLVSENRLLWFFTILLIASNPSGHINGGRLGKDFFRITDCMENASYWGERRRLTAYGSMTTRTIRKKRELMARGMMRIGEGLGLMIERLRLSQYLTCPANAM